MNVVFEKQDRKLSCHNVFLRCIWLQKKPFEYEHIRIILDGITRTCLYRDRIQIMKLHICIRNQIQRGYAVSRGGGVGVMMEVAVVVVKSGHNQASHKLVERQKSKHKIVNNKRGEKYQN